MNFDDVCRRCIGPAEARLRALRSTLLNTLSATHLSGDMTLGIGTVFHDSFA